MTKPHELSAKGLFRYRLTRRAFLASTSAAALAACAPIGSPAPNASGKPDKLIVGIGAEMQNLNPLARFVAPLGTLFSSMWESPINISFTPKGEVLYQPGLAESWRVLDDKKTWEFKLRQGIKFSNGEDWDAEAFAFSVDWIIKEKTALNNMRTRLAPIYGGVKVVDKYTVQVMTKEPFVLGAVIFGEAFFAPPKYYASVGPTGFAEKPVGIGQFNFSEWIKGDRVILKANPNYWGDKPAFETLVFKSYPEDATRLAALEAGEIDIAVNVPPDSAKRLESQGFRIEWSPVAQGMQLTFKMITPSPLQNARVRQAMNLAIDKKALTGQLMSGYATALGGQLVSPSAFGFSKTVPSYPYDPEKAKALLREAGFPNGFTMNFDTSQGRYVKQKEVSEFLVGEYRKVGITLNMQMYDWDTFIDKIYTEKAAPVFLTGRNWFPYMDDDTVISAFWSKDRAQRLNDPEYDRMFMATRAEFDPAKRKELLGGIHKWLYDYAAAVPLMESTAIYGLSKRIKGFAATPDDRIHFETVQFK